MLLGRSRPQLADAAHWDGWMVRHRLWSADRLGLAGGALLGYVVVTIGLDVRTATLAVTLMRKVPKSAISSSSCGRARPGRARPKEACPMMLPELRARFRV